MWDAIVETPGVIRRCLSDGQLAGRATTAGREIVERRINRVFLVGCGTSYNAAVSTAHALNDLAGIDADAYDAFEFSRHKIGAVGSGSAVIVFSHSGSTRAAVDSISAAARRGAFTICLTDMPADSPLARSAGLLVPVGGGAEAAEPKTRSYINAVVVGYEIAVAARGDDGSGTAREELRRIPALLEDCRALEGQIRDAAQRYSAIERVFVVSGGPNYSTALEIALKLKEAVLVAGEGLEVEEAFHGPIASLDRRTLVITVSAPGASYERVGHFALAASKMGSPVLSVTPEPYGISGVETVRVSLQGVRETFSGSVLVYPLYLFAYHSALVRGNNPDFVASGDGRFHDAMSSVPSLSC